MTTHIGDIFANVEVEIFHNGASVIKLSDKKINQVVYLSEGVNELEVVATDKAGNVSQSKVSNIILDTTPPSLISSSPLDSATITDTQFLLSLVSNESLSSLELNGIEYSD